MVRLEELVTTKRTLDLGQLLAEDSTFYGDLFAHVVEWEGTLYLEDGLHRALRAALQQRPTLHARVLVLDCPQAARGRAAPRGRRWVRELHRRVGGIAIPPLATPPRPDHPRARRADALLRLLVRLLVLPGVRRADGLYPRPECAPPTAGPAEDPGT